MTFDRPGANNEMGNRGSQARSRDSGERAAGVPQRGEGSTVIGFVIKF